MKKNYNTTALIFLLFSHTDAFSNEASTLTGEILYTGELWKSASGGIDSGSRYLHNIDITYGGELDNHGIEGGAFFLYALINNKSELSSDLVGDLQVISNIDNGEVFRLYEAWYQHEFSSLRAKIGLIDLNSEFDVIETAGLFINSSHGIGPDFSQTGENGPSIFPSTSPAFVVGFDAFEQLSLTLGIFDAVPNDPERPKRHKFSLNEGALIIGEANYIANNDLRIGLGIYTYTSRFPTALAPSISQGGNTGIYGIIESPLNKKINGWLRYGMADSSINYLKYYLGGGLVLSNPFTDRTDEKLGIALGWANAGEAYKKILFNEGQHPAKAELNIELTYHYPLSDNISIQPDIQYVINPAIRHDLKNALVLGIRFQIGQRF